MLRVARFLHGFVRSPARVGKEEITLPLDGGSIEATLLAPRSERELPGWIVLHGITVPGRHHPVLLQFCRALAASGGAVVLPDVPAWRDLRIAPRAANEVIAAAVHHLAHREGVAGGGVRVVGFSFGATQAIISSTDPRIRDEIRSVVGFGGYCDLPRTLRCMMTGRHEWRGREHRFDPDPYGRWIVAANFLPQTPGFEHMAELTAGLRQLAAEAGQRRVYAADPMYDPLKARIRERLDAEQRAVWDVLAPPSGVPPDENSAEALAAPLVETVSRLHPELDPRRVVDRLTAPVVLAHGVEDRLIPYTEMLRLAEAIDGHTPLTANLTRLFAHSTGGERLAPWEYPVEAYRYVRMLHRALNSG